MSLQEDQRVLREIISEMLEYGPRPAAFMVTSLSMRGFTRSQQETAKKKLDIKSRKLKDGSWVWELPT